MAVEFKGRSQVRQDITSTQNSRVRVGTDWSHLEMLLESYLPLSTTTRLILDSSCLAGISAQSLFCSIEYREA